MASVSNGTRGGISRAAAKAYWLALPPDKRTHQAVADRFKITRGRVTQIASQDRWAEALARIDAETVRQAERQALRTQLELADVQRRITAKLQDRALAALEAAEELTLDQALRRLPGIIRTDQLLAGEATDRIARAEVEPVLTAYARIAVMVAPPEQRVQVLAQLEAASAGLVQPPAATT